MRILDPMGNPSSSDWILIQPVDDHDQGMLPREMEQIRASVPDGSFCMIPVRVDWFSDLPPWPAPAAFRGQPDFGDGALLTLHRILDDIVSGYHGKRVALGGYSLAGFFALWAGYQTDQLDGIVAASPSVWYPGWDAYLRTHQMKCRNVYLSLGDREERTRNPVMRTVGDRIREQYRVLDTKGIRCTLNWNEGDHFRDPEIRTAAGFVWIMKGD